jgi:hypothetical protein
MEGGRRAGRESPWLHRIAGAAPPWRFPSGCEGAGIGKRWRLPARKPELEHRTQKEEPQTRRKFTRYQNGFGQGLTPQKKSYLKLVVVLSAEHTCYPSITILFLQAPRISWMLEKSSGIARKRRSVAPFWGKTAFGERSVYSVVTKMW